MAENGLVINNGATAGTRPPKSFELYVMDGMECRIDGEVRRSCPGLLFLLCEVMETSSGPWLRLPTSYRSVLG